MKLRLVQGVVGLPVDLPAPVLKLGVAQRLLVSNRARSPTNHTAAPVTPISINNPAASSTAAAGRRRAHLAARSSRPAGLAAIGSPRSKRRRSSARAAALG